MAKYAPLARYLRRQRAVEVLLTFREIERILGSFLPKASTDPGWWRPQDDPSAPPQQQAFAEAGVTPRPDIRMERVLFVRTRVFRPQASAGFEGDTIWTEGAGSAPDVQRSSC